MATETSDHIPELSVPQLPNDGQEGADVKHLPRAEVRLSLEEYEDRAHWELRRRDIYAS